MSDDGLPGGHARAVAIAYHVLGSVSDAEEIAQDAAEAWVGMDPATVDDAQAWVAVVTTRRAIDRLRARERRRETYVGPWLPEPRVHVSPSPDPGAVAGLADEVSYALMVVLDRLTPAQRVAFVLHDLFDLPFRQVGELLGTSTAAARQSASRARRRVRDARPVEDPDPRRRWEVAEAFLEACRGGDQARLLELLAPDVELVSDGGGLVSAARNVVHGSDRVSRMVLGLMVQASPQATFTPVAVGADPGLLIEFGGEVTVVVPDIVDGQIAAIHVVRNPDKLRHLASGHTPPPNAGPPGHRREVSPRP